MYILRSGKPIAELIERRPVHFAQSCSKSARFYHASPHSLQSKKSKLPQLMVKMPDGTERPRQTAIFKRMQMERWRAQNAAVNAAAKAAGFKHDWIYKMSVIVTRPTIVLPEPEPWEVEYAEWREKWYAPIYAQIPDISPLLEDESTHGPNSTMPKNLQGQGQSIGFQQRSQERSEEVRSRLTAADLANDTTSLRRKLDQKLYFIVKKNRSAHPWQFPQFAFPVDHSDQSPPLSETASAGASKAIGSTVEVYMTGNSPCGFYTYPISPELQVKNNAYGIKVFFYRGYYIKGTVERDSRYVDHAWITVQELSNYFEDKVLCNYLKNILI